jgi:hemolysin activation/secretion protein
VRHAVFFSAARIPAVHRFLVCIPIALWFADCSSVYAQTPLPSPGAVQEQQRGTQEYFELQKRLREQQPTGPEIIDKTQRPAAGAPGGDVRVRVKTISVGPSEVLSQEELRSVTANYEGREVSLARLFELIDEINALYKKKGCLTCRAFLPAQTVEDGKIEVRLVEAKSGELEIEGNTSTRSSFLKRRISTRAGELFDVTRLERDLEHINATTDLQTTAELKAGADPGTVTPVVRVAEPPHYRLSLFADNAGAETVGEYRGGLTFLDSSVFGLRDAFFLSAYGAEGTRAVTTSYSLPVHPSGTRVALSYDYSDIKVIDGPFEALDIGGYASRVGLDLTQPIIANSRLRLNALALAAAKHSVTTFSGIKISELDVRSLGLGFDLQSFGENGGTWYTRNVFTQGFADFGGDRDFSKFNGDLYRIQPLTPDVYAQFRLSLQWSATHPLPSTEQFQLGGSSTVRGYKEGLLTADEGAIASAELHFPVPPMIAPGKFHLGAFAFLDSGVAVVQRSGGRSVHSDDCLYSIGAGISFDVNNRLNGRLVAGVPLNKPAGYDENWRLEFFVQALLF